MNFQFNQISSGLKTIKIDGGYHKVTYSVCVYDNIIQAVMSLNSMPEVKAEDVRSLTGECPVDMAEEMIRALVDDIKVFLQNLNDQESA